MNNSEPLRIERGQFMRGSEIVAPEIGNREQIQLLQYYERVATNREEQAKRGTLPVSKFIKDCRFTLVCELTCVCGCVISKTQEKRVTYCYDTDDLIAGDAGEVRCSMCGRKYQISDSEAKLL